MIPIPDLSNQHGRILIVDDEPVNCELLRVMLAPQGFEMDLANSGAEALLCVSQEPPDLVLLDLMMPEMDGTSVVLALKSNPVTKHIPIIMVTALHDRETRLLALSSGAEDFLTKPVDRAELIVRVRNLLRLKAYGDYFGHYSEQLEADVTARTHDLIAQTEVLRKQTIALRESEERVNYTLGAAHMGTWNADLVTEAMTWSATMGPLHGLPAAKTPSDYLSFMALIHPDDRETVNLAVANTIALKGDADVEYRVILPDGTDCWLAGRITLRLDEAGKPARLMGVAWDITERKSLEAQLRQSQRMDAVGQLAGGVAHDFNNLLTAILGFSHFVLETLGAQDPRRSDMEEVIKAGQRAAVLTSRLLAFSRKQVLQPTAVDLNALVINMETMLSRLIGEHVELVPVLASDLRAVRADAGQVEQVLMNLVINARDAMPEGGRLTVTTANVELNAYSIENAEVKPGPYVMMAVTDSGTGITEATRQRLFEPFFTTKEHGRGTGLGLSTVYGIVKQSGGYIWVHGGLGTGATFKVFLPVDAGDYEPPQTVVAPVTRGGHETILIVEDDPSVRTLTCRVLKDAGYDVLVATDPADARARFGTQVESIHLLVSDIIMPGTSGPDLFRNLRKDNRALKVLYVSGYTDDTIVHKGILDHGVQFLQKPFMAETLKQRVREVLDVNPA